MCHTFVLFILTCCEVSIALTNCFFFISNVFQLFLFLQDFSQRMLSKTHEIERQLDSLIRDTKATDSCLHSVFNDFLMLSNTQFIENVTYYAETYVYVYASRHNFAWKPNSLCLCLQRVYDEEVEENILKTDGPEKLPEQV